MPVALQQPPRVDGVTAARLAAIRVTVSPRKAEYTRPMLRGDNARFYDSTDSEAMLSGPAETGKTFAALSKLNAAMWDNPGAQGAIVRKLRATMDSTVLVTYRRILGKDSTVTAYGGEHPDFFDYPNGSRVYIGGMDNAQKVLSSERDIIYVNQAEELSLDDWEVLTTRATGRGAVIKYPQVIGDCNPGAATHWILNRAPLRLLYSRHEDNPTLYDEAGNLTDQGKRTMTALDNLTGVRYKRLRKGLWSGAEGMVYEGWDRSIHVVSDKTLQEWGVFTEANMPNKDKVKTVVGAVDWGWTNPGCIQVWAADNDGRAYLIHEVYMTNKLIGWWVAKATTLKAQYGIRHFYCDPAEPAYIEAFNEAKLGAVKANNDIPPGIQAVQDRLPVKVDGRARLYVYSEALEERDTTLEDAHKPSGLIEEKDGYIWPKTPDGKPNKEVPVDKDNHALDTERYAIMALDSRPKGLHSW